MSFICEKIPVFRVPWRDRRRSNIFQMCTSNGAFVSDGIAVRTRFLVKSFLASNTLQRELRLVHADIRDCYSVEAVVGLIKLP